MKVLASNAAEQRIAVAQGEAAAKPVMADSDKHEVTVEEGEAGARLDRFLALRSAGAQPVAPAGADARRCGDQPARPSASSAARSRPGETYEVRVPAPEPAKPAGEAIALAIVYEDADI